MDDINPSYWIAAVAFSAAFLLLVGLYLWEKRTRPKRDELEEFAQRAQHGDRVKHEPEGVVYLDSARVSRELRNLLAKQRKN